jgi:ferredoxin
VAVSEPARRRLRVNPILCDGYGYCAEIVPELISVDDWGFPIVSSRPIEGDNLARLAQRAVTTCPRLALVIEETAPAVTEGVAVARPGKMTANNGGGSQP